MTLQEWSEITGHIPAPAGREYECRVVADEEFNGMRVALWNLTDYHVTGVVGGTIWLYPKKDA